MLLLPLLFGLHACRIPAAAGERLGLTRLLTGTISSHGFVTDRNGTVSSARAGEFIRGNDSNMSLKNSVDLRTSVKQSDEAKAKTLSVTTMEPVTVGVLLGISVLGSLFNAAITKARLSEAQSSAEALHSASQKLLSERTSVCLATRALSFQSMLLSVQTEVFLKAASRVLAQANLIDQTVWSVADFDRSGTAKEPPTWAEVEAARKEMLAGHAKLLRRHAINREKSVQALCAQRVDSDLQAMRREEKATKDVDNLHDKLMNDWVSVLFGSFSFVLFDPTLNSGLAALPKAASAVATAALGGGIEGTLDVFEDSHLQELNKMVGDKKAPLWALRALNAISHFLGSGILGTQGHVEVILYSIRAGVITAHGLIQGNLKTAISTKDPTQRIRELFNVIENSFWLIRDIYQIIYGHDVPWNLVGVFAIFQNIRVAFEIGTNWAGFHQQVVQHRQILRMSKMDSWKQHLTYRFSACLSFIRTESLASEQYYFLLAFQQMLQALPSSWGTASPSTPDVFAVEQASLRHTIQNVLDESPQFCYQALLAPKSNFDKASAEREALGVLLHEMSESQLHEVRRAALWGPITDLAVSENAEQDAAYAAMGFFEPVLGWRLWACRGCSKRRILHAVVCHGTEIVGCLQQNEAFAHEEFRAVGDIAVEVMELPTPQPEVLGGFSQIYRQRGVQPRLLFVTALLKDVQPNTPVLKSLEWGRLAYSVFGKLQHRLRAGGPMWNVTEMQAIDSHNKEVDVHEATGARVIANVQLEIQKLTNGGPKTGVAVRRLWEGYSRLNEWSTDSYSQLAEYTGPSLYTAATGNPTTQFALDFASATFQNEDDMTGEGFSFTKVLITVGYSCHWAAALRLHRGIQRIRTPTYFRDIRKDMNHAMIEGWLFDEEAWHGQAGENTCSGYSRMLQHLPVGCHPLSVVDLRLQPLSPPEAPGDMCKRNETRALSVPTLVEEVVLCTGKSCSLQKADIKHWEFAGQWKAFRSTEEPLVFELWVRRSQMKANPSAFPAEQRVALKQNLPEWINQTTFNLQQFRAVLADALCSERQCHFRSGPKSLPQLLGLPSGAVEIPSYLSGWALDWAEVLDFGRDAQKGINALAGMPQIAFARRRRQSQCTSGTQYLRDWANQHQSTSTLMELRTLADTVQAASMSFRHPNSTGFDLAMLNALGEVHRAGALPECEISSNGAGGADSLADVLLTAAAAHAQSGGECGFELLVPIQPMVACQEADGLGLQLTIRPDATIVEHCAHLDEQPAVANYLVWFSLRAKGADELGVNARRTAREIADALTSDWGYSMHMPLSQQAQGCVVPLPAVHVDKDEVRRLVFRQEVWTLLDPRLSGQSSQVSRQQMCELKDSLQDDLADVGTGTNKRDALLSSFRDQLISEV